MVIKQPHMAPQKSKLTNHWSILDNSLMNTYKLCTIASQLILATTIAICTISIQAASAAPNKDILITNNAIFKKIGIAQQHASYFEVSQNMSLTPWHNMVEDMEKSLQAHSQACDIIRQSDNLPRTSSSFSRLNGKHRLNMGQQLCSQQGMHLPEIRSEADLLKLKAAMINHDESTYCPSSCPAGLKFGKLLLLPNGVIPLIEYITDSSNATYLENMQLCPSIANRNKTYFPDGTNINTYAWSYELRGHSITACVRPISHHCYMNMTVICQCNMPVLPTHHKSLCQKSNEIMARQTELMRKELTSLIPYKDNEPTKVLYKRSILGTAAKTLGKFAFRAAKASSKDSTKLLTSGLPKRQIAKKIIRKQVTKAILKKSDNILSPMSVLAYSINADESPSIAQNISKQAFSMLENYISSNGGVQKSLAKGVKQIPNGLQQVKRFTNPIMYAKINRIMSHFAMGFNSKSFLLRSSITAFKSAMALSRQGITNQYLLSTPMLQKVKERVLKNNKLTVDTNLEHISSSMNSIDNQTMQISYLLPVEDPQFEISLYQVIPFPHFELGKRFTPTIPFSYLAISHTGNKWAPIHPLDAAACIKNPYSCSFTHPLTSHINGTCGVGGFIKQHDNCNFVMSNNLAPIFRVFGQTVLYRLSKPVRLETHCENSKSPGSEKSETITDFGYRVIPKGCYFTSSGQFMIPNIDSDPDNLEFIKTKKQITAGKASADNLFPRHYNLTLLITLPVITGLTILLLAACVLSCFLFKMSGYKQNGPSKQAPTDITEPLHPHNQPENREHVLPPAPEEIEMPIQIPLQQMQPQQQQPSQYSLPIHEAIARTLPPNRPPRLLPSGPILP